MTGAQLIVHPTTGEALELRDAETERLAATVADVHDLRGRLADFASLIEDELLARLDRRATWTLRVGDPTSGRQLELRAPSPAAGSDAYDGQVLDGELEALIARGTIDADAAAGALLRTVTITVAVPFGSDLDELTGKLQGVDAIAGVPCRPVSVSAARKVVLAGVKRLRKVAGTGAALDRAKVTLPVPSRRVKVSVITKAGVTS